MYAFTDQVGPPLWEESRPFYGLQIDGWAEPPPRLLLDAVGAVSYINLVPKYLRCNECSLAASIL